MQLKIRSRVTNNYYQGPQTYDTGKTVAIIIPLYRHTEIISLRKHLPGAAPKQKMGLMPTHGAHLPIGHGTRGQAKGVERRISERAINISRRNVALSPPATCTHFVGPLNFYTRGMHRVELPFAYIHSSRT